MKCPKCESEDTARLEVIYLKQLNINNSGRLRGQLNPPTGEIMGLGGDKGRVFLIIIIWISIMLPFAIGILDSFDFSSFYSIFSVAFPLVAVASIIVYKPLSLLNNMCKQAFQYNNEIYPKLYKEWQEKWFCNRCGERYNYERTLKQEPQDYIIFPKGKKKLDFTYSTIENLKNSLDKVPSNKSSFEEIGENKIAFEENYKEYTIYYSYDENYYFALPKKYVEEEFSFSDKVKLLFSKLNLETTTSKLKSKKMIIPLVLIVCSILFGLIYFVYDDNDFNILGLNQYTNTKFDVEGYNKKGYDEQGYDRAGYNKDGYDSEGYNADGYDKDGKIKEKSNETNVWEAKQFAMVFVTGMLNIPETAFKSVDATKIDEKTYIIKIAVESKIINIKVGYVNNQWNIITVDL